MTWQPLVGWALVGLPLLGGLGWGGVAYHRHRQAKKDAAARARRRARRAARQAAYPPVAQPAKEPASQTTSSLRGRRPVVLVVDDSATALRATRDLLEEKQYQVLAAENGRKAWSLLQSPSTRPDVVISDIDMPMMDGFQLLQLIRTDLVLADLPVILMTGKMYYHVQAGKEEGVSGLLSKPFNREDLFDQLRFVLQE